MPNKNIDAETDIQILLEAIQQFLGTLTEKVLRTTHPCTKFGQKNLDEYLAYLERFETSYQDIPIGDKTNDVSIAWIREALSEATDYNVTIKTGDDEKVITILKNEEFFHDIILRYNALWAKKQLDSDVENPVIAIPNTKFPIYREIPDLDEKKTFASKPVQVCQTIGESASQESAIIAGELQYVPDGDDNTQDGNINVSPWNDNTKVPQLLQQKMQEVGAGMREYCANNENAGGSTALVSHISTTGELTIANVGDSRAVLFIRKDDGSVITKRLTADNNPADVSETFRIEQAGGYVVEGRVSLDQGTPGTLLSRGLGDNALVSYEPDMYQYDILEIVQEVEEEAELEVIKEKEREGEAKTEGEIERKIPKVTNVMLVNSCAGMYEKVDERFYEQAVKTWFDEGDSKSQQWDDNLAAFLQECCLKTGSEKTITIGVSDLTTLKDQKLTAPLLMGVFDGHEGATISAMVAKSLNDDLLQEGSICHYQREALPKDMTQEQEKSVRFHKDVDQAQDQKSKKVKRVKIAQEDRLIINLVNGAKGSVIIRSLRNSPHLSDDEYVRSFYAEFEAIMDFYQNNGNIVNKVNLDKDFTRSPEVKALLEDALETLNPLKEFPKKNPCMDEKSNITSLQESLMSIVNQRKDRGYISKLLPLEEATQKFRDKRDSPEIEEKESGFSRSHTFKQGDKVSGTNHDGTLYDIDVSGLMVEINDKAEEYEDLEIALLAEQIKRDLALKQDKNTVISANAITGFSEANVSQTAGIIQEELDGYFNSPLEAKNYPVEVAFPYHSGGHWQVLGLRIEQNKQYSVHLFDSATEATQEAGIEHINDRILPLLTSLEGYQSAGDGSIYYHTPYRQSGKKKDDFFGHEGATMVDPEYATSDCGVYAVQTMQNIADNGFSVAATNKSPDVFNGPEILALGNKLRAAQAVKLEINAYDKSTKVGLDKVDGITNFSAISRHVNQNIIKADKDKLEANNNSTDQGELDSLGLSASSSETQDGDIGAANIQEIDERGRFYAEKFKDDKSLSFLSEDDINGSFWYGGTSVFRIIKSYAREAGLQDIEVSNSQHRGAAFRAVSGEGRVYLSEEISISDTINADIDTGISSGNSQEIFQQRMQHLQSVLQDEMQRIKGDAQGLPAKIFLPMSNGGHWTVLEVGVREDRWGRVVIEQKYFNPSGNAAVNELMNEAVKTASKEAFKENLISPYFKTAVPIKGVMQSDASSCGPVSCFHIGQRLRGEDPVRFSFPEGAKNLRLNQLKLISNYVTEIEGSAYGTYRSVGEPKPVTLGQHESITTKLGGQITAFTICENILSALETVDADLRGLYHSSLMSMFQDELLNIAENQPHAVTSEAELFTVITKSIDDEGLDYDGVLGQVLKDFESERTYKNAILKLKDHCKGAVENIEKDERENQEQNDLLLASNHNEIAGFIKELEAQANAKVFRENTKLFNDDSLKERAENLEHLKTFLTSDPERMAFLIASLKKRAESPITQEELEQLINEDFKSLIVMSPDLKSQDFKSKVESFLRVKKSLPIDAALAEMTESSRLDCTLSVHDLEGKSGIVGTQSQEFYLVKKGDKIHCFAHNNELKEFIITGDNPGEQITQELLKDNVSPEFIPQLMTSVDSIHAAELIEMKNKLLDNDVLKGVLTSMENETPDLSESQQALVSELSQSFNRSGGVSDKYLKPLNEEEVKDSIRFLTDGIDAVKDDGFKARLILCNQNELNHTLPLQLQGVLDTKLVSNDVSSGNTSDRDDDSKETKEGSATEEEKEDELDAHSTSTSGSSASSSVNLGETLNPSSHTEKDLENKKNDDSQSTIPSSFSETETDSSESRVTLDKALKSSLDNEEGSEREESDDAHSTSASSSSEKEIENAASEGLKYSDDKMLAVIAGYTRETGFVNRKKNSNKYSDKWETCSNSDPVGGIVFGEVANVKDVEKASRIMNNLFAKLDQLPKADGRMVYLPVNIDHHWVMLEMKVYRNSDGEKRVLRSYLDPSATPLDENKQALLKEFDARIVKSAENSLNCDMADFSETIKPKERPTQSDANSCGPVACFYARQGMLFEKLEAAVCPPGAHALRQDQEEMIKDLMPSTIVANELSKKLDGLQMVRPQKAEGVFQGSGRADQYRYNKAVFGVSNRSNSDQSELEEEVKDKIETTMAKVIHEAAESVGLHKSDVIKAINDARKKGGIAHSYDKEDDIYLENDSETPDFATLAKFSRLVQKGLGVEGIYSGRERKLHQPIVGLRTAFIPEGALEKYEQRAFTIQSESMSL